MQTFLRARLLVIVALAALAVACGGGNDKSSPTPDGGSPVPSETSAPPENAQALVIIASPGGTHDMLAAALQAGVTKVLVTGSSRDAASFEGVQVPGEALVYGTSLLTSSPSAGDFDANYEAAYGRSPEGIAGVREAYDAVYTIALAAAAANSTDPAAIRDNVFFIANSPGEILSYGRDNFLHARDDVYSAGLDTNYIGASGQVDFDSTGDISKGSVEVWRLLGAEIAPLETRDVDLKAEIGADVPEGTLSRAQAGPDSPLVIGGIASLTGDDSDAGTAVRDAMQLAADEINSSGGLFGQPVELAVEDDFSDPDSAAGAASALLDAGASAIVGPANPDAIAAAANEVTVPAGVPMIALSSSPALASVQDNNLLFRTAVGEAAQMPVLANIAGEMDARTVCVVHEPGAVPDNMATVFQQSFEFKENRVRANVAFEAGQDYATLLSDCMGG